MLFYGANAEGKGEKVGRIGREGGPEWGTKGKGRGERIRSRYDKEKRL